MHAVLAEDADPGIVKLLIERGADVNVADHEKWTALHFAGRDHKAPIVGVLLEAGAKADPVDSFGDTPLWRAVTKNADIAIVKALVEHGADPYKRNNHDVAPIDMARTVGRDDIVALLEARAPRTQ